MMSRWELSNVLVAGRRVSGEAGGRDAAEAVRRLAAAEARSRGVDIAAAIAGALRDKYKKVSPSGPSPVKREADAVLPSALDYTEWPALVRVSESD